MKNLKQLKIMLAALLMVIFLAACGSDSATEDSATETTTDSEHTEVVEPADEEEGGSEFPITITDAVGQEVTLEAEPERIVSLIPSVTETIFALDAGDAVVGRTDNDTYPEEVTEIESVGEMNFDVERVIALTPDLVLTHSSHAERYGEGLEQLRNAGIPVIVVEEADSIETVYETIEMIGLATGASEEAEVVVTDMQEKFAEVQEKASTIPEEDKALVWVEVAPAPDIYTTGQNTFFHEMLTIINAKNAAGEQDGWVPFTEEQAVAYNPDVILITYGFYVDNAIEGIKERAAWQDVPAVVNDRIYDLNADEVVRPGPRLAEGVEQIAKAVYPEVFGE